MKRFKRENKSNINEMVNSNSPCVNSKSFYTKNEREPIEIVNFIHQSPISWIGKTSLFNS